jgi:hypothetical protein
VPQKSIVCVEDDVDSGAGVVLAGEADSATVRGLKVF